MVHGGLVFTAGQIPLDPASGRAGGRATSRAQTERVLQNLAAVLEAAGAIAPERA